MGKILIVVAVVGLVVWLIFGRRRKTVAPPDKAEPTANPADAGEAMVACAHCGVHLPRGDAVADGAASYCSTAHRVAGPRER